MPSDQKSSPATLEEHLLHPTNLKAAKALRSGSAMTASNEIALKVRWSPNQAKYIHDQLSSWLTTGEANKLVVLLKNWLPWKVKGTAQTQTRRFFQKVCNQRPTLSYNNYCQPGSGLSCRVIRLNLPSLTDGRADLPSGAAKLE